MLLTIHEVGHERTSKFFLILEQIDWSNIKIDWRIKQLEPIFDSIVQNEFNMSSLPRNDSCEVRALPSPALEVKLFHNLIFSVYVHLTVVRVEWTANSKYKPWMRGKNLFLSKLFFVSIGKQIFKKYVTGFHWVVCRWYGMLGFRWAKLNIFQLNRITIKSNYWLYFFFDKLSELTLSEKIILIIFRLHEYHNNPSIPVWLNSLFISPCIVLKFYRCQCNVNCNYANICKIYYYTC